MDSNRDSRPSTGSSHSSRRQGVSRPGNMTAKSKDTQTNRRNANGSSPHAPSLSRHSTHRYHHSHCGTSPSSAGPPSRMSDETREESRQTTPAPVSNLLQERLQSLRKAESKRTGNGVHLSSSVGEVRDGSIQNSPLRRTNTATGRQSELNDGSEVVEPNGFSVREIEQTLSTLHKQNFDLKLELFHRRDRQDALEERNRSLESECNELTDVNDKLVAELETRDRAVEEAVGMIVELEARVEQLLREREMVRQVEADGAFFHASDDQSDTSGITATPRWERSSDIDDAEILGRMPSFLSERSDHTENLRNVLSSSRNSLARLRRVSESSADPSELNRVISPSLSVLSESSFASIYGNKTAHEIMSTPRPAQARPPEGGNTAEALATSPKNFGKESWGKWESRNTPSRTGHRTPRQARPLTRNKQQLTEILATDSPLQMLERKLSMAGGSSRSSTPSQAKPANRTSAGRLSKLGSQTMANNEKREALRRVITGSPTIESHPNAEKLPPTPDTISTSTLRRCQDSDDALRSNSRLNRRKSLQSDNTDAATASSARTSQGVEDAISQTATTSAFTSRKLPSQAFHPDSLNYNPLADDLPVRPRSADETTISRHYSQSWASDLDLDGNDDMHTDDSNFDYWMRESNKDGALDTPSQARTKRSTSPDLFSFPIDSRGWETDALFGALRGDGFVHSPVSGLQRDPLDVAASLPSQSGVPQPPDRRSSLLAHTSSATNNGMSPRGGKLLKSPTRGSNLNRIGERARSNSIDSAAGLAARATLSSHARNETIAQQRQYPPIAGQPTRPRGLGALIRRSLGHESHSLPPSASEGTFPANALKTGRSGRSSVPPSDPTPWAPWPSSGPEDELTRATPPPILRNRATAQVSDHTVPVTSRPRSEGGPGKLGPGPGTTSGAQNANAGKRKWLGGLSRMTGSKKTAG